MRTLDQQEYVRDLAIQEWQADFTDEDGEAMDDQQEYWHIPGYWIQGIHVHDRWIPDDAESIITYLRQDYDVPDDDYGQAIRSLHQHYPDAKKEVWDWDWDDFDSSYEEE